MRPIRFTDLTGQVFGALTVTAIAPNRAPNGEYLWLCDCAACGKKNHPARRGNLRSGRSTTCGCVHRRNLKKPEKREREAAVGVAQPAVG